MPPMQSPSSGRVLPPRRASSLLAVGLLLAAGQGTLNRSLRAEDVSIPRERLLELESRARRVEALEAEVQRLEAEVARIRKAASVVAPVGASSNPAAPRGDARGPATAGPAAAWIPPAASKAAEKAGSAPAVTDKLAQGSTVDLAHVLEHFGSDPAAALARYKGVKARFRGVVADVDKPLFMAPYDVVFRRADTPVRVRARLTPPAAATRVFVAADRMSVLAEGGGRRETLARVGEGVELEGVIKGFTAGMVELTVFGAPRPWAGE